MAWALFIPPHLPPLIATMVGVLLTISSWFAIDRWQEVGRIWKAGEEIRSRR